MEQVFIDGTHIKANANSHKYEEQVFLKEARHYEKELQEEIKKIGKLTVKSHTRKKKYFQKKEKEKSVRPTQTAVGFIKESISRCLRILPIPVVTKIIIFWTSQSRWKCS